MAKVFISGQITGRENYEMFFNEKAKELHSQGHIVLNPSMLPLGMTPSEYMSICYSMIDVCDIVYFLYGWSYSKGSRLEFNYACQKGKKLMFEETNIDATCFQN